VNSRQGVLELALSDEFPFSARVFFYTLCDNLYLN
jgi:hypothetical protein